MNLNVLRKGRKKAENGDIFVFQLKQEPNQYRYGRVINAASNIGGFKDTIMIYMYNITSSDKTRIPDLNRRNLLVEPMATNQLPWSKGYFEYVENRPIESNETFEHHYFRDFRGKLFDEHGNEVARASEPIGEYGLQSYKTIDDKISMALGYPV
ncbi:Imm26 family immunity protein [Coraliomargarita sp. SDUM461003]|uniref:Imm26 family immunity protein n=1 Tax=Thalassobacterium maritimum TaxID=3041265 RepID=A0ABU1APC0_9BACT|nr:Imm26 family immunity protein [Coraliomargarita sp. SDUM461003]MDQ8205893.1 Imm26 family immunity protein [Coraliomargarita sp. SDUM461003]